MSPDHVNKSHVIDRLGTISSFPQNLVHIQFFFETLVDNIKNWYYKVRQLQSEKVLQNETENRSQKFITQCDRGLLQTTSGITNCDKGLLQTASGITKCDGGLLQTASGITTCDGGFYKVRQVLLSVIVVYYKVRQVLQSALGIRKCERLLSQSASYITKCDNYYKVRRNKGRKKNKDEFVYRFVGITVTIILI